MSSLSICIKRLGLGQHEDAILRALHGDYIKDGYGAHEAAVNAVKDYAAQLDMEETDIHRQVNDYFKEKENAQRVREDAGQVPSERGAVEGSSAVEGSGNLEQQTSGEPGDRVVGEENIQGEETTEETVPEERKKDREANADELAEINRAFPGYDLKYHGFYEGTAPSGHVFTIMNEDVPGWGGSTFSLPDLKPETIAAQQERFGELRKKPKAKKTSWQDQAKTNREMAKLSDEELLSLMDKPGVGFYNAVGLTRKRLEKRIKEKGGDAAKVIRDAISKRADRIEEQKRVPKYSTKSRKTQLAKLDKNVKPSKEVLDVLGESQDFPDSQDIRIPNKLLSKVSDEERKQYAILMNELEDYEKEAAELKKTPYNKMTKKQFNRLQRVEGDPRYQDGTSLIELKQHQLRRLRSFLQKKYAGKYSWKTSSAPESIGILDVMEAFPNQKISPIGMGGYSIELKNGVVIQVKNVKHIDTRTAALEGQYKGTTAPTGEYKDLTIKIRQGAGDRWTLHHESVHLLVDLGILTPQEMQRLTNRVVRDINSGKMKANDSSNIGSEEDIADWIADQMDTMNPPGLLKAVWEKIKDFVDAIVSQFSPTARSVVRGMKSGKVWSRPVQNVSFNPKSKFNKPGDPWYSETAQKVRQLFPKKRLAIDDAIKLLKDLSVGKKNKPPQIKEGELRFSGVMEWLDQLKKGEIKWEELPTEKFNNYQRYATVMLKNTIRKYRFELNDRNLTEEDRDEVERVIEDFNRSRSSAYALLNDDQSLTFLTNLDWEALDRAEDDPIPGMLEDADDIDASDLLIALTDRAGLTDVDAFENLVAVIASVRSDLDNDAALSRMQSESLEDVISAFNAKDLGIQFEYRVEQGGAYLVFDPNLSYDANVNSPLNEADWRVISAEDAVEWLYEHRDELEAKMDLNTIEEKRNSYGEPIYKNIIRSLKVNLAKFRSAEAHDVQPFVAERKLELALNNFNKIYSPEVKLIVEDGRVHLFDDIGQNEPVHKEFILDDPKGLWEYLEDFTERMRPDLLQIQPEPDGKVSAEEIAGFLEDQSDLNIYEVIRGVPLPEKEGPVKSRRSLPQKFVEYSTPDEYSVHDLQDETGMTLSNKYREWEFVYHPNWSRKLRQQDYNQSHWPELGTFAHARTADLIDKATGEKWFHIDELQSDFFQKRRDAIKEGVKKLTAIGYTKEELERDMFDPYSMRKVGSSFAFDSLNKAIAFINSEMSGYIPQFKRLVFEKVSENKYVIDEETKQYLESRTIFNSDIVNLEIINEGGEWLVQDKNLFMGGANFVNYPYENNWETILLKRLIKQAVDDGGYVGISWTRGIQQVRRYSYALRKQVSKIGWEKVPGSEGRYTISIYSPSNENDLITQYTDIHISEESDYQGRPMSVRILLGDHMTKIVEEESKTKDNGSFKGDELAVGGHGFQQVYDEKLPNILKKLFNKSSYGNPTPSVTDMAIRTEDHAKYEDFSLFVDSTELGQGERNVYVIELDIQGDFPEGHDQESIQRRLDDNLSGVTDYSVTVNGSLNHLTIYFGNDLEVDNRIEARMIKTAISRFLNHRIPRDELKIVKDMFIQIKVPQQDTYVTFPVFPEFRQMMGPKFEKLYRSYTGEFDVRTPDYKANTFRFTPQLMSDVLHKGFPRYSFKNKEMRDNLDAGLKTLVSWTPANLPHMTFLEKILKSPEWYSHPALKRIVDHAVRRTEVYNDKFTEIDTITDPLSDSERVSQATILLKNKGLTKRQIFKGKSSKEYDDLVRMIEYGDTQWVKDNTKSLEENLRDFADKFREEGVSEETIAVWKMHRDAYDRALDMLVEPMRDFYEKRLEESSFEGKPPESADIKDFVSVVDEEGKKHKLSLKAAIAKMNEWKGFYAPRLRDRGNWAVRGAKDNESIREHFTTRFAAEKRAIKLRDEGWDVLPVEETEKLSEEIYQNLNTVSVEELLKTAVDKADLDSSEMKMAVKEALLKEAADLIRIRGFRSHMVRRRSQNEVVKGYIEDPLERYTRYASNISAGLAKAETAQAMAEEVFTINSSTEGRVKDTALRYIQEQLRNMDHVDQFIGLAKSVASLKYLGLNFRSPLVNMTALFTTVPPAIHEYALGGKTGMARINKEILKGIKDGAKFLLGAHKALQRGENIKKTDRFNQDEFDFLKDMVEKKYVQPQATQDIMGVLQGSFGRTWGKVMRGSMKLFELSEQLNRTATVLAAFRLAKEQGKTNDEARTLALDAMNKAHGIYGRSTLPSWAQGKNPLAKIGQMFYVYQKFAHNWMQMAYDLGAHKKNFKAFAWTAALPFVIGGSASFVLSAPLYAMAKAVMRAMGDDRDPEKLVNDGIRKHFGAGDEKAFRYGLFGAMGMDLSGSLSPLPGVPTEIKDLFGVFGGVAQDFSDFIYYINLGTPGRALEVGLPTGVSNLIRSYREREGVTTRRGRTVFDDDNKPYIPSAYETALRAGGIRSSEVAQSQQHTFELKKEKADFTDRRDRIYELYRNYLKDKDANKRAEVIRKMREYNQVVRKNDLQKRIPLITFESLEAQQKALVKPRKAERK